MTFNFTVHLWWFIPLLITIGSMVWVHWMTKDDTSLFAGVGVVLCMVPAMFVSLVAWIVGAACK